MNTTTNLPVKLLRKGDDFLHPVTGTVCTVLSNRAAPQSTLQRRIQFAVEGRGRMTLDMGPAVQAIVR
jgi:hypothetical protein